MRLTKVPCEDRFVLAVLSDWARAGEREPYCLLDPAISVREWCATCVDFELDLEWEWDTLGHWLNERFGVQITDMEWAAALWPDEERRLQDVCDLIASHCTRTVLEPSRLLGSECRSTTAFLAVRRLLEDAGEDVARLRPRTPLAYYLRRHPDLFRYSVSRLAPGTLPPLEQDEPVQTISAWLFVSGLLGMITAATTGNLVVLATGAVTFALSYVAALLLPSPVTSAKLGTLRTFRDLALAMVHPPEAAA